MAQLRLLYDDPHLVAVDKPAGFYVHPPEASSDGGPPMRIPKSQNTLALLRDQLGTYLYPVHRLDRATSGVLVFAKSSAAAGALAAAFADRRVHKTYFACVRGYLYEPILLEEPIDGKEARTRVWPIRRFSSPEPVGRHPEARATLVAVSPETGRTHQIRRHLKRAGHPLFGDTVHGDGRQNQWMRALVPGMGLCLKSYRLTFPHPVDGESVTVTAPWNGSWHRLFDRLGVCGYLPGVRP